MAAVILNSHPNMLAIFGVGGHSHVVADCARLMNRWERIEFFDDGLEEGQRFGDLCKLSPGEAEVFVAVGDNKARDRLIGEAKSHGCKLASIGHPSSIVAGDCEIGGGSVLMAGAIVNPGTTLGLGCIVNTAASVDHHCELGACVHVAPGARLAGGVTVGARTWIGIGSVVREGKSIGADVIVGAAAAVVSDIADGKTVTGVPAK